MKLCTTIELNYLKSNILYLFITSSVNLVSHRETSKDFLSLRKRFVKKKGAIGKLRSISVTRGPI